MSTISSPAAAIEPVPDAPPSRPLPVRAVLFDLDGTLLDSAADLAAAVNRIRTEDGLVALPLDRLRPFVTLGARGMLLAGMELTPLHPEYERYRDRFLDYYEAALCVHTVPFQGVATLLHEIGRRGLRWGVVTNKSSRFTEPLLRAVSWPVPIGCTVSGDSTANTKPHPAPLLLASQQLGIAPERCVYVGDAERDVQAANAAGMHALVAEYGYIGADETPRCWPADGWISAPLDLLDWLPATST